MGLIRSVRLLLAMAALCCSEVSSKAADPSVEVFSQGGPVGGAGEEGTGFVPQIPFRWALTVSGGFDDNVNTSTVGDASPFTQVNLTLSKDLRTPRTLLTMVLSGGAIHYFDRMSSPSTDYTGNLLLNLQHNVSDRLALGVSVTAAYQQAPQFATDLGSTRQNGNYFSTSDVLSARYLWSPRFSTYTSFQLAALKYENAAVGALQDRVDYTFGESLRYLWSPRTTIFGEYKYDLIDYDTAPQDSSTHYTLVGLDYQISTRSNITLVGGATFRKFKQGNTELQIDPNASASMNYLVSPYVTVSWTAGYSVEEPNSTEVLSQKTVRYRTGLAMRYQPSKRWTSDLTFNYSHDENSVLNIGSPGMGLQNSTEDAFEFVIESKYALTDRWLLDLRFAHSEVEATLGYSRNVSSAGFTFRF